MILPFKGPTEIYIDGLFDKYQSLGISLRDISDMIKHDVSHLGLSDEEMSEFVKIFNEVAERRFHGEHDKM